MDSKNFKYLSRLDHLRFFAAVMVVLFHFKGDFLYHYHPASNVGEILKIWLLHGHTGVSLFLVLSAFLFTLICHAGKREIDYKKFIYNRILRIFPLMVVIVFIIITINRGDADPLDILRVLTLQLNTGHPDTGWGQQFFPSGPIWTIAVEFQFYLIFPFLIAFFNKYKLKWIFGLILLMICIRFVIVYLNDFSIYYNLYHSIIGRLEQFLFGIIFGFIYIKVQNKNIGNIIFFLIFVMAVTLITMLLYFSDVGKYNKFFISVFTFPLEGFLWGWVILCYLMIKIPVSYILKPFNHFISWLGGLSFSIYLLHLPIGIIVSQILDLSNPTNITESIVYNIVRLPFIIMISALSFYTIEKPFMSLRTKYLKDEIKDHK